MESTKKKRRIIWVSSILGVLIIGVLVGLIYMKLFGLKKALEELVYVESDQKYSLSIGRASVDVLSLSFKFDSLVIKRNPALPESGIRQVRIPMLKLQVAKLGNMLRFKKFDIKTLVLDEPFIDIDNPERIDSLKERFHLGQQIVKLYPAIESVVERFNIEYLKINSAALGVKNHPKPPLNLSLIDFLIEEWEEGKMGDNSQIQLLVGKQDLVFEKARFSFTALEYNFKKRQLQIDDLQFSTEDSLSNSHVEVAAKYLVLTKLGYQELFENQVLTYDKVSIVEPEVDIHLIVNTDKSAKNAETNEKEVLTRLVKQTVGECNVDTLIIDDAQINLVLQKEKDSTRVILPNVDFTLYTFSVINESETFVTGPADIVLDKTSIELTDGITISCQKLIFDQDQNLIFTDVELYDAENKMMVIDCKLLSLEKFHLLALMFDKELLIKNLALEDAVINIPPENIFGSSKKGKSKGLEKILIDGIDLRNVALNYAAKGKKIAATGVSMRVKHLIKNKNQALDYQLSDVVVAGAQVDLEEKQVHAKLRNIDFKGRTLNAQTINLTHQNIEVTLKNLSAKHRDIIDDFKKLDYSNWNEINADQLTVIGELPEKPSANDADTNKVKTLFSIAEINLKELSLKVKNSKMTLSLSGNNIDLKEVTLKGKEFAYKSANGLLKGLDLEAKDLHVKAEEIALAMPAKFDLKKVDVIAKKLHVSAPNASIHGLHKRDEQWAIDMAKVASINLKQEGHDLLSAENITVKNAHFGGGEKPFIGFVEAFKPQFTFAKKKEKASKGKAPNLAFLDLFGDYILHDGVVNLPEKQLFFGKTHGNALNKSLSCAYIKTELKKMHLLVNGFSIDSKKLLIDSINLSPNKTWYNANSYAQSVLSAKIFKTHVSGFVMDSLLHAGKLENLIVDVNGFHLNITKDQRLPDPPYIEKPASLEGLLKLPKNISLKTINVKNGSIDASQVSAKTGEEGFIDLSNIWANVDVNSTDPADLRISLTGGAKIYNEGVVNLNYNTVDDGMFALSATVTNFDMTKLNRIITPLNAIEIRSGHLENYNFSVTANNNRAIGKANITYDNLHMIIYKKAEPEKKNLGSELLTLLADGLVIKNSKTNATTELTQQRVKNKTTFDYWIKSATNGAIKAIREGKRKR